MICLPPPGAYRPPAPEITADEILRGRIEVHLARAAAATDDCDREAELAIARWLENPVGVQPPQSSSSPLMGPGMITKMFVMKTRRFLKIPRRCPTCGGKIRIRPCLTCVPYSQAEQDIERKAENKKKTMYWRRRYGKGKTKGSG